jgi:hypothetical protein
VLTTHRTPEDRIILLNAWNEWAEGSHLEPDRKHGFGYLQAVHDALCQVPGAVNPPASTPDRPTDQPKPR